MKKRIRTDKKSRQSDQDMQPEYDFDYSEAQPNRFAKRIKRGSRVVVIEPDVAKVFSTPDSVNSVLRALIETMPRDVSSSSSKGRTNS